MEKKLSGIIALLFMGSMFVFAESAITITFKNSTGYTVKELYVSPTSHDDWYDNLLKGEVVPNGKSVEVVIPEYGTDEYVYDIMAVDTEGDSYSKYEVDLTDPDTRMVEFTFDDYEDNQNADGAQGDDQYSAGYRDGYRDAYRDAYSEAYKEGYKAGLEEAGSN